MATQGKKDSTHSHCNTCMRATNHSILHSDIENGEQYIEEGGYTVTWNDTYELLKCRGCDSVHMRHTSWFSEDPDNPMVFYFPPIASRRKPDWLDRLISPVPPPIKELLNEIYTALHAGSQRLVAMGIRSLIEAVMVKEVGDHGTFVENLKQLHMKGLVSERDRDALEKIIEAGHAVTHRQYVPSTENLKTLLDITEALLAAVYVHPVRSAELKKRIPPRK